MKRRIEHRIHNIEEKVKRNFFISLIRYNDKKLLILVLFLVSSLYSFIAVILHNRFMTFGLDTGVFDEWIWKVSRGMFPYSGIGCNWMLEDHFQVILYAFAPLYWIWEDARVLLISQAFIMVFAAAPLFLLSKAVTRHVAFSFSVVFAYLFFIGTQFAILNEFHQITVAPLFIATAYYGLHSQRIKLFLLCMVGLLITKEDLSLLVAAIGIGLLFQRNYRLLGIWITIVGISFFFFLLYIFMPAISVKGIYNHFDFGEAGYTPIDVVSNMIKNPLFFAQSMVHPPVKIQTIVQSLLTYGFLPILAPLYLLVPLLEDFVTRFIYAGGQYTKWGLVNHHAAVSSMLLTICSVYGASRLSKKRIPYTFLAFILFGTTVFSDIIFHGPINSLLKPQFYHEEQWVRDVRNVISQLPRGVSTAAQNSIAPHVAHRDSVYRIPYGLNSEYMVVDLHDGPNKYAPLQYGEMKQFVDELLTSGRYSIEYQKGEAMLLKRNYKTDITKSKYYGNTKFCYYSWEER